MARSLEEINADLQRLVQEHYEVTGGEEHDTSDLVVGVDVLYVYDIRTLNERTASGWGSTSMNSSTMLGMGTHLNTMVDQFIYGEE